MFLCEFKLPSLHSSFLENKIKNATKTFPRTVACVSQNEKFKDFLFKFYDASQKSFLIARLWRTKQKLGDGGGRKLYQSTYGLCAGKKGKKFQMNLSDIPSVICSMKRKLTYQEKKKVFPRSLLLPPARFFGVPQKLFQHDSFLFTLYCE